MTKKHKSQATDDTFFSHIEELIDAIDRVRASSGNLKPITKILQPRIMEEISLLYYETMNGLITGISRLIMQQCTYDDGSMKIEHKRMWKIMNYLQENYAKEIKEEQIAEYIGMTVPSFCRFFKEQTRYRFIPFLNKFRINQARRLLEETDDPIAIVGYSCGYNDVTYFIKLFKKETGKSPGMYRKEIRFSKVI